MTLNDMVVYRDSKIVGQSASHNRRLHLAVVGQTVSDVTTIPRIHQVVDEERLRRRCWLFEPGELVSWLTGMPTKSTVREFQSVRP